MLVVALHAQSHSQSYTVAAQASERIIVRVTSGHVCLPPTTIISLVNVTALVYFTYLSVLQNHCVDLSVFFIVCLSIPIISECGCDPQHTHCALSRLCCENCVSSKRQPFVS